MYLVDKYTLLEYIAGLRRQYFYKSNNSDITIVEFFRLFVNS